MGLACADTRLAYVQHPFPAQGQTTDTAHLIIGEHATQEGSYVALTRAREQTHVHAASAGDEPSDRERLKELSDRMSRTEPDVPSIHTPLVHQSATAIDGKTIDAERHVSASAQAPRGRIPMTLESTSESLPKPAPAADQGVGGTLDKHADRAWPRSRDRGLTTTERTTDRLEGACDYGWEP